MSTWQEIKNNSRLKEIFQKRTQIIRLTREFFWSHGFIEAETPVALRYASQEPYLNFFPVTVKHPMGQDYQLHLRTSPEFSLKKLLAADFSKVFEIGKCFRNEEDFGGMHNPEFTMIEWYRAPGSLEDIMDDTEALFKFVSDGIKNYELRIKNASVPVNGDWDRVSMREVWKKFVGVELNELLELSKLAELAKSRGYQIHESDAYEDLFFKIFLNEIEPHLGIDRPVFVYDYPAQMCSLSRPSVNPGYAERFELYIGGLEIANAFGELTDAAKQKELLEKDRLFRQTLGKETWPVDPDFIAALESGIPASASGERVGGIALGVDRMVVLFTAANDINEVIFQSISDQLN